MIGRDGRPAARGYAELPQHFPRPGWVEHDPEEIWGTVLHAVRGALRHAGLAGARSLASRVEAVGITNQRETVVLWSRRTGKAIGRAIVWQDRRTASLCDMLRRRGAEPAVRRTTGLLLDPYFSGTKLLWRFRHERGLPARARRGEIAFGTVDSWVLHRLTGGGTHATDPTNASRTLLYDIRKRRFDDGLLDLFETPREVLPEVRASAGPFGETRGVPGIPDGIPILGIAGDQQAALFGQGCVERGSSKNTYGTGCFVMVHTGSRPVPSRSGLLTTVACGPRGEARYALEGSVFIAGAALQWLRDGLGILDSAAGSERIARSVPDAGGVLFVPAFVGLGAPYWRPDARGAILGLTRGTRRAHLVRAAIEAMAYQSADLLGAMERDSRTRIRTLRVDGGAARNDLLLQFQADLLGVPVLRPREIESTALGAGYLAGLASGFFAGHGGLARARVIEKTFRPGIGPSRRRELLSAWRGAIDRLLARPASR